VKTTADIAGLLPSMPGAAALPAVRAAWFGRKVNVFDQIAEAGGPEAVEARHLALHARATAALIRRGRA
jgi:hypothetical protein